MDDIPGAKLWNAIMQIRKYSPPLPEETGLHMGEFFALHFLYEKTVAKPGEVCVSDLHSKLMMSKPGVSQLLNSLEKKGYLSRDIHAGDRRKIQLLLTPQGLQALEQCQRANEHFVQEITLRFGEQNTEQLALLLTQLAQLMQAYHREQKDI